ncbi:MAG: phosphocholine cytidylyltransferase family protein [Ignavibacteria bacterium]|nr:phosphocholine cytidylyltransferase family protein [Ignavibacteria bacterium]
MQAVILAAGIAKRLRPYTNETPKCLLDLGGGNILQHTINNLINCGINDFIFVLGFKAEMIKDFIEKNFKNINSRFILNPDYENNNNSYSLWLTKDYVNNQVLLLDSDILFDKRIVNKLLDSNFETCIALKNHKADEEQIKVLTDNKSRVLKIGKDVDLKKSAGESIGIEKLSKNFLNEMYKVLDRKILRENNVNEFYEVTFQELIDRNNDLLNMYAVDVSEYECLEIDTIEDFQKAKILFKELEYKI